MTDNYYAAPQTIEEPLANPRRSHSIAVLFVIGLLYLIGLPGLAVTSLSLVVSAISGVYSLLYFDYANSISIWSLLIPCFVNLLFFALFLSVTKTARQMYRFDRKAKTGAMFYLVACAVVAGVFAWMEAFYSLIPLGICLAAFFVVAFVYTKSYCEPLKTREEEPLVARIVDLVSPPDSPCGNDSVKASPEAPKERRSPSPGRSPGEEENQT